MQKNICVLLLVVTVLNAAAAGPALPLKWRTSVGTTATGTINLYRQFYEYAIAVLNQGIPALGVAPLDPIQCNDTRLIFQGDLEGQASKNDVVYTNMTIEINGLTVSGFSDIVVENATLDWVALSSLLSLYNDEVLIVSNDLQVNATDSDGELHFCHCDKISATTSGNSFYGFKQLSLNGLILQVDQLIMDFETQNTEVWIYFADCSGDLNTLQTVVDTVDENLNDLVFNEIPDHFNQMADEWKIILNDIFALRNVTYDATKDSPKPLPRDNLSMSDKDGHKAGIQRSISRSSYKKNAPHRPEASPKSKLSIKYNF